MSLSPPSRLVLQPVLLVCALFGQQADAPNMNPAEVALVVRQMVQNEVAGHDKSAFVYRMDSWDKNIKRTSWAVDTDQGTLTMLVCVNDASPTPAQQSAEDKRVRKFLADPEQQRKKAEQDRQDNEKVSRVLKYLGDGLLYEYESGNGTEARFRFKPNPDFKPPSMEARVFQALSGVLTVDLAQMRMKRIEGSLIKDVSIGYGILATLYAGGTFVLQQSEVAPNYWALTAFEVNMHGKALLIKEIDHTEKLRLYAFERAPQTVSFASGYDLLKSRYSFSCPN
jgi:hypothetical protein